MKSMPYYKQAVAFLAAAVFAAMTLTPQNASAQSNDLKKVFSGVSGGPDESKDKAHIDRAMDRAIADRNTVARWRNPATGHSGFVRITKAYRDRKHGLDCLDFQRETTFAAVRASYEGQVCKEFFGWTTTKERRIATRKSGRSDIDRNSGESGQAAQPKRPARAPDPEIRDLQETLQKLGYDPGAADGFFGRRTRQAIVAFEKDRGRPAAGKPTAEVRALAKAELAKVESDAAAVAAKDIETPGPISDAPIASTTTPPTPAEKPAAEMAKNKPLFVETSPIAPQVRTEAVAAAKPEPTTTAASRISGAAALAMLKTTKACERCDLSGVDFSGLDLRKAKLGGALLANANLSGASAKFADFSGADLSGATLEGAIVWKANFSGARLVGARLQNARANAADFAGADLTGSDLTAADLSDASFARAKLLGANLKQANLRRAGLSDADLTGAGLQAATMDDADLDGATLIGADFTDARLIGVDLTAVSIDIAKTCRTAADGGVLNPNCQ